ncbi:MAG: amidohydrolase [Bdellovibrionia bacterium]
MGNFSLGVRAGYLLTMKGGSTAVLRDQFVGISAGTISAVAPWADQKAQTFIDARDKVVMPGLINGHTHLPMSLFRGLADDLPFDEWLHGYILPLEGEMVDSEFVRTGTELSALELIRFGVTTVCDSYFFEDVVGDVLDRAGLRGLVSECVSDYPTPDKKNSKTGDYDVLERMLEKFKDHERVQTCIAPHAPYSCSDDTLKKAAAFAGKHGLTQNIHVSETEFEVADSRKKYGKSPVRRLKDLGVLELPCVCAHCVHLDEDDMKIMAETGASAIHNPQSNMKLSAGCAPVPAMLKNKVKVGLGTDGAASNNNLNLFEEMKTAALLQKLSQKSNSALGAAEVLKLATHSGAAALGLGDKLGSLETGKLADLIVVGLDWPHLQPVHDIPSQLAYAATGLEVETVVVQGRVLFEKGEFKTLDRARIFKEASVWRDRIRQEIP